MWARPSSGACTKPVPGVVMFAPRVLRNTVNGVGPGEVGRAATVPIDFAATAVERSRVVAVVDGPKRRAVLIDRGLYRCGRRAGRLKYGRRDKLLGMVAVLLRRARNGNRRHEHECANTMDNRERTLLLHFFLPFLLHESEFTPQPRHARAPLGRGPRAKRGLRPR